MSAHPASGPLEDLAGEFHVISVKMMATGGFDELRSRQDGVRASALILFFDAERAADEQLISKNIYLSNFAPRCPKYIYYLYFN